MRHARIAPHDRLIASRSVTDTRGQPITRAYPNQYYFDDQLRIFDDQLHILMTTLQNKNLLFEFLSEHFGIYFFRIYGQLGHIRYIFRFVRTLLSSLWLSGSPHGFMISHAKTFFSVLQKLSVQLYIYTIVECHCTLRFCRTEKKVPAWLDLRRSAS